MSWQKKGSDPGEQAIRMGLVEEGLALGVYDKHPDHAGAAGGPLEEKKGWCQGAD